MNDSTRGKCLNAPGTLQRQGKNACMEEKLLRHQFAMHAYVSIWGYLKFR